MDPDQPMSLLGGLSVAQFLRRHWQRKPLVVRAALPDPLPSIDRRRLFALATQDDVESRLVVRSGNRWTVRPGPIGRRALPSTSARAWTLLVQGVDLHDDAAHRLLQRFRFLPDARLDDVMCSWAADAGGVGPHVDSYDVFLLQTAGRRRWRVGRSSRRARLRDDVPLKMLADFSPTAEWLLEPGDMLYLPPGWGHEGVAVGGDCITASIGFRAPAAGELAADLLDRIADIAHERAEDTDGADRRYGDAGAAASRGPARIPEPLQRFAWAALDRLASDPRLRERALGEVLSEPKAGTSFDAGRATLSTTACVVLDRRTRMLYDEHFVFINGEAVRAGGRDAALMRRLANERVLDAKTVAGASAGARALMAEWLQAGWCLQAGDRFDDDEEPT